MYRVAIYEFDGDKPYSSSISLLQPDDVTGGRTEKEVHDLIVSVRYPEFIPEGVYSTVVENGDTVDGYTYVFMPYAIITRLKGGFRISPLVFTSLFTLNQGVEEALYIVMTSPRRLSLSSPELLLESGLWSEHNE